jgi:hypothetical protein
LKKKSSDITFTATTVRSCVSVHLCTDIFLGRWCNFAGVKRLFDALIRVRSDLGSKSENIGRVRVSMPATGEEMTQIEIVEDLESVLVNGKWKGSIVERNASDCSCLVKSLSDGRVESVACKHLSYNARHTFKVPNLVEIPTSCSNAALFSQLQERHIFDHFLMESKDEVTLEYADDYDSEFHNQDLCIFGYGSTGSGKTYTMMGEERKDSWGVIPSALRQVHQAFWKCKVNEPEPMAKRRLWLSAIEIYNENVQVIGVLQQLCVIVLPNPFRRFTRTCWVLPRLIYCSRQSRSMTGLVTQIMLLKHI